MSLAFRPHHFLCALCFQGKGYSPGFIKNFSAIMDRLNSAGGEETAIRVVNETDAICAPCPHRLGKTCVTQEKITVLDQAHASALELAPNETLTWGNAKQRIKDNITLASFHAICASCDWKPYGLCENALSAFLCPPKNETPRA